MRLRRGLRTLPLIRRHSFAPADNRRLAHLCGPLDAHLRQVEAALGVTLARREAVLRIEGPRDAVDQAAALLDAMYAKAEHPIGERTLQLMLVKARSSASMPTGPAAAPSPDAPIVLHTRHAELAGRTPNQVQYLRHILSHDLSFGIGPAGTGKTFLAVAPSRMATANR